MCALDADVIVIGAGAAGLAAAAGMGGRSLRVTVVEARDRIGGRVLWTDGSDAREPVELGAEFIHGRAPETMALMREAGTAAVGLGSDSWTCERDGSLTHDDAEFRSSTDVFAGVRALKDDETVDAYLRRFERDPALGGKIALARAFVEGFDAADPSTASVMSIAEELWSGVDYATAHPAEGYRPIFDVLRSRCEKAGVSIELSTVVKAIRWRRGEVEVETVSEGVSRLLRAKAVIVTLPVSILRLPASDPSVGFDPALPPDKLAALEQIEMGHVVKVVLRFREPFWERVAGGRYIGASFFRCPYGRFPAYWTQRPLPGASVVAWAGGPPAVALQGASGEALVAHAFDEFSRLFGYADPARAAFVDGLVHDWSRDPFALGAYSYVRVGGMGARAVLGMPVEQTLFFAGEATALGGQGGTVNGAIATGERAAREAAAALAANGR